MDPNMHMNMNGIMYPIAENNEDQQQPIAQQYDAWVYNPMVSAFPSNGPDPWSSASAYQQPRQHPRLSTSTQSSFTSDHRASNASDLSYWYRSSMASTNSSWSNISGQAYTQRRPSLVSLASIGSSLNAESPMPSYAASPAEEAASPLSPRSKRRPKQRQVGSEKDPFATCVSRARRNRRSQRVPRYWCTSCEEPFIEKYDWKRHEETYQERPFVFRCNLCSAIYFLEKDFVYHHETRHNCETCSREGHLEAAKRNRQTRTGWGCGFCTHFSTSWRDRCNHIAQHFEDGKSMQDWRHADVVLSLLQRPVICAEWLKILQSQPQLRADFGWNLGSTGRVEGYPENGKTPNLQDVLEYYRPGDDAVALAQLAFQKIAFPPSPPQAPRKDYKDHHNVTLQSLMDQPELWHQFTSTILEDPLLPENVCDFDFDFNTVDDAFNDDATSFTC